MIRTRRGAALLLALAIAGPRGAAAHSLLLGSDPAEGAALPAPPAAITLRFNEPVRLTAIRLFAADGAEWPLQRPRDMAPSAEHGAGLGRALTPGPWRVVWRAISADGHEIGGTLRFRLEPPAMILEYLQPDPSALDAGFVLLRAATHVAMLGAAGLALFGIGFGAMLAADDQARLRRWMLGLALAGIALNLGVVPLRVLVLTAGASAFDGQVLAAVLASRNGDALWIRLAALAALALAAARPGRAADALAGAGALAVAASYAALGHSMLFRPRQELAGLVTLHLLAVAFWAGSLPPLAWAAARGQAAPIEAWSRAALWAVAVVAATGLTLAVLLVRRGELLLAGWYGWALLAKLALVGAMLALAARHRWQLVPRLPSGGGGSLARSIRIETVLALLVAWAAAELVSVHPLDAGHRIAG